MARFVPILVIFGSAAILLTIAQHPALLYTAAALAGVVGLAGLAGVVARLLQPVASLVNDIADRHTQRRVMELTARSQARALVKRTSTGSTSTTSQALASSPHALGYAAIRGRVAALLARGYSNHRIVVDVWHVSGGRQYQAAMRLVESIRQEMQPISPPALDAGEPKTPRRKKRSDDNG